MYIYITIECRILYHDYILYNIAIHSFYYYNQILQHHIMFVEIHCSYIVALSVNEIYWTKIFTSSRNVSSLLVY